LNRFLEETVSDYCYLRPFDETMQEAWVQDFVESNCFKFSVVRNPWDRLVSGWRNKIQTQRPVTKKFLQDLDPRASETELALYRTDFISFVHALPDSKLASNIHFRPQSAILQGVKLDFTARFERYNGDLGVVLDRIGLSDRAESIPHMNKSWSGMHYSQYYDSKTRDLVSKLFRKDIIRWGYAFV